MDIKTQFKIMDLLGKLVMGNVEKINANKYKSQKPKFNRKDICEENTVEPEQVGIKSSYIEKFLVELSKNRSIDAHTVLIMKDGKVITRAGFYPYTIDRKQISHSLCKSIVALVAGIAIDEGIISLEDKIVDIFKINTNIFNSAKMKNITIENLLTMTSGINFNEAGSLVENDWSMAYFDSSVMFEPGERFAYNSLNTYMVARAIEEKSGEDFFEYMNRKLLEPLEITDWYWEKCPEEHVKAGWGLSYYIDDFGKIGCMCLNDGVWNGKRIVSKDWIKKMSTKKVDTPLEQNKYGYSYFTWIGKDEKAFIFNGMLGQNVVIIPENKMVIVVTAGSKILFPNSEIMDYIEKYFIDKKDYIDSNVKRNVVEYRHLNKVIDNLKVNEEYTEFNETKENDSNNYEMVTREHIYHGGWKKNGHERIRRDKKTLSKELRYIDGKCYSLKGNVAGILPLFLQCLHNNYEIGMSEIEFRVINSEKILLIVKSFKTLNEIEVGMKGYIYSDYTINDEVYEIASRGKFSYNEDNRLSLDIKVVFVETTNTRTIKIVFKDNAISMEFNELPEILNIIDGVSDMLEIPINDIKINPLATLNGMDFAKSKVESVLMPKMIGERI